MCYFHCHLVLVNGVFKFPSLAHELFRNGLFGLGLMPLACTETRDHSVCDRLQGGQAGHGASWPARGASTSVWPLRYMWALLVQGQGKGLAQALTQASLTKSRSKTGMLVVEW